jgi:hypothetical protein
MKHKTDKVRNKKHKIVSGCEPDKEKKERFLQNVHKENLIKQRMNVCQRVKKKLVVIKLCQTKKSYFFPKKYKDGRPQIIIRTKHKSQKWLST